MMVRRSELQASIPYQYIYHNGLYKINRSNILHRIERTVSNIREKMPREVSASLSLIQCTGCSVYRDKQLICTVRSLKKSSSACLARCVLTNHAL
jgi:hypothetical protein